MAGMTLVAAGWLRLHTECVARSPPEPGPAVDHEYSTPTVDHLRFGKLVGPMFLGTGASDEPRSPGT